MSSYDAAAVIAEAINAEVKQPKGSFRLLLDSDEAVALAIINALEEAGFEIVRRTDGCPD